MSDTAPASTETAQTNGFAEPQTVTTPNDFKVPEAYQGKPWVDKIKSQDDVWKTLDNAQGLIGKKTNPVPAADAPDEAWNEFYKLAGRPDDVSGYAFKPVDGTPEGMDLKPFQDKAAKMFHEAGLSPKQGQKIWEAYLKDEFSALGGDKERQAALDKEFDEVVKTEFGEKYEQSSKNAQALINKFVPESLKPAYQDLADKPKAMAAVIKALDAAHNEIEAVKKEYGKEGALTSGDASTGENAQEVLQKLTDLRLATGKLGAGTQYQKNLGEIKELETKYRSMIK